MYRWRYMSYCTAFHQGALTESQNVTIMSSHTIVCILIGSLFSETTIEKVETAPTVSRYSCPFVHTQREGQSLLLRSRLCGLVRKTGWRGQYILVAGTNHMMPLTGTAGNMPLVYACQCAACHTLNALLEQSRSSKEPYFFVEAFFKESARSSQVMPRNEEGSTHKVLQRKFRMSFFASRRIKKVARRERNSQPQHNQEEEGFFESSNLQFFNVEVGFPGDSKSGK